MSAREGLDISLFNLFHFENQRLSPEMHAGHAAAAAPVATPPPPQQQQRRVYVAAHCQQTPGEIAAEFVRADTAAPPPPSPQAPSVHHCANAACVNRAIDHSEFHIELVCTHEHITRVHNKQCEAALLGDRCLDCGEDTVARAVVRINERGERIVKPQLTAAPAVTVAQAKIAPPAAAAPPRKSKAALRRERRAQQQLAAAAKKEVVDDDPEQHHPAATQLPPPQPLVIDDSERVRRLAAGQVASTRVQKVTHTSRCSRRRQRTRPASPTRRPSNSPAASTKSAAQPHHPTRRPPATT
jgi:hypothetical protein